MPRLSSSDQAGFLDGIAVAAIARKLSFIRVLRKDTHDPVLLLCTEFLSDNKVQLIPVAELIVGTDLDERYIFPEETRELIDGHQRPGIDVGIPGFDTL